MINDNTKITCSKKKDVAVLMLFVPKSTMGKIFLRKMKCRSQKRRMLFQTQQQQATKTGDEFAITSRSNALLYALIYADYYFLEALSFTTHDSPLTPLDRPITCLFRIRLAFSSFILINYLFKIMKHAERII
jgi:hypothetical protein